MRYPLHNKLTNNPLNDGNAWSKTFFPGGNPTDNMESLFFCEFFSLIVVSKQHNGNEVSDLKNLQNELNVFSTYCYVQFTWERYFY